MTTGREPEVNKGEQPDAEADARYRRRRRRIVMAAFLAPLGLLVGYGLLAHLTGGAVPTCGLPLGGDRGELRRTTASFWEDLQFKDYESAARYHAPGVRDTVDIPFLIQRLFVEKPELLDIMDYEIAMVDIDSSGLRARVRSTLKVKHLANGELSNVDIMLYYKRAGEDAPWYMDLENSLRSDEAEEGKLH